MRLLLVKDDTMIGKVVLELLVAEHHSVNCVKDGEMADMAMIQNRNYGLVLFDVGLPCKDGFERLCCINPPVYRSSVGPG
jgi:two-component system response regulator QseB